MMPPRRPTKQIAVAAQLDHVAGVDEAVGVRQRRRVGAEIAQRGRVERMRSEPSTTFISTVAVRVDDRRRESRRGRRRRRSRRPPRSRHRHARHARVRIELRAGRRAWPRRRSRRTGAHSAARCGRASPLISALRQCDGVPEIWVTPRRAEPDEEARRRSSLGPLSVSDSPPEQRAQEDLQAAVAADVVERRPVAAAGDRRDRAGQRRERVDDELRRAAGARGRQDPFGRRAPRAARRAAQAAGGRRRARDVDRGGGGVAVVDAARRPRPSRASASERVASRARRAEHDLAREAVELDQRRRRLRHVADREQDACGLRAAPGRRRGCAASAKSIEAQREAARRDARAAAARGDQARRGSRLRQARCRRRR